tara:strand:- start:9548 stop:9673 length:126 start_codon:yes stop_codon:yes gene_type:complete
MWINGSINRNLVILAAARMFKAPNFKQFNRKEDDAPIQNLR